MNHTPSPAAWTEATGAPVAGWLGALEERHLADLRFAEVTRALRALSSAYVERRREGRPAAALDSAGKRAAFALFYAPLHFMATACVVKALDAATHPPARITDYGCGTGVCGAAWALACDPQPALTGIDRHPWAVEETRWTYAQFGLRGRTQTTDLPHPSRLGRGDALVAGYVLNELAEPDRLRTEARLERLASQGVRILVLEPVSRRAVPWWEATAERLGASAFRADEWRFEVERPPIVRKLDEASGLDHRTLTLRTLYHA